MRFLKNVCVGVGVCAYHDRVFHLLDEQVVDFEREAEVRRAAVHNRLVEVQLQHSRQSNIL